MGSRSPVQTCSDLIHTACVEFLVRFEEVTRRAPGHFENRDWHACETDNVERLELNSLLVQQVVGQLEPILDQELLDESTWEQIRTEYSVRTTGSTNAEIFQTFFNSVTRELFDTDGVNARIEFTSVKTALESLEPSPTLYRRYPLDGTVTHLVRTILGDYRFESDWVDLDRDAARITARIDEHLRKTAAASPPVVRAEDTRPEEVRSPGLPSLDAIDTVHSVFFRMKHAYIVGRMICGDQNVPWILCLLHRNEGIYVDAVLLDEDETSILFSFTRAYFHVLASQPRELVLFLRSILPKKPSADLYLSIGFHKHGKTEIYRRFARHLESSSDRFVNAEGARGMVMIVFTLPSYELVFKIIRDRFAYPKNMTPRIVKDRYQLVFERDRVGRLVEAQSFEHIRFPRNRFSGELLEELRTEATHAVRIDRDEVSIDHLYTERKVRPLNLYLGEVERGLAEKAVIDYGHSIKELAAANIFPGDFLPKNFGVTRHGRVVFYDYDELCLLTECNFRSIPEAQNLEDELSAEPWFRVGPNDIFPEEFPRFLGIPKSLMGAFLEHHADLFTAKFWQDLQDHLNAGEILDVYPYPSARRL